MWATFHEIQRDKTDILSQWMYVDMAVPFFSDEPNLIYKANSQSACGLQNICVDQQFVFNHQSVFYHQSW